MQKTRFPPHHRFPNRGVSSRAKARRMSDTLARLSLSARIERRRVRCESHICPILSPRTSLSERTTTNHRMRNHRPRKKKRQRCVDASSLSMTFRAARLEMMSEVYSFQEQQSSSFSSQSRDKKGANILSRALCAERWSSSLLRLRLRVCLCVRVL